MPNESLLEKATGAFTWNVLGSFFRAGSGFAVNILLSRLLGPGPFGTMAIVLALLGFGTLVLDSGLSAILVRKKILDADTINGVQGLQLLVGIFLAILLLIVVYPLSLILHQPELISIGPWLAVMLLFTAILQVPQAVLRRRLDFRAIQQAQILSYLVGYILFGVIMSLRGFGIWSLIVAQMVQIFVNTTWVVYKAGLAFKPNLKVEKSTFGFGVSVLLTNLINWVTMNFDTFIVGNYFGKSTLGFYNRVNFLFGTPLNILSTSLQPIIVSTVSRSSEEAEKVRSAYLSVVEIVAWIALPMFLSVSLIGNTVIDGIYGNLWMQSVPLVAPVSFVMAIASLGMLPGPVLIGLGRVGAELRNTGINLVISVPLFVLSASHSIVSVAWSVAASRLVFCFLLNRALSKYLHITLKSYLNRIVYPLVMSTGLAVFLCLSEDFIKIYVRNSSQRLVLLILIDVLIYLILIVLSFRSVMSGDARNVLFNFKKLRKVWEILDRMPLLKRMIPQK